MPRRESVRVNGCRQLQADATLAPPPPKTWRLEGFLYQCGNINSQGTFLIGSAWTNLSGQMLKTLWLAGLGHMATLGCKEMEGKLWFPRGRQKGEVSWQVKSNSPSLNWSSQGELRVPTWWPLPQERLPSHLKAFTHPGLLLPLTTYHISQTLLLWKVMMLRQSKFFFFFN